MLLIRILLPEGQTAAKVEPWLSHPLGRVVGKGEERTVALAHYSVCWVLPETLPTHQHNAQDGCALKAAWSLRGSDP